MVNLQINLKETQKGYVPLEDRFKSFPADSENMPVTDFRLYYDAFANARLERGTLDLLYPTPKWLKSKLKDQKTQAQYLTTGNPKLFKANNKFLVIHKSP